MLFSHCISVECITYSYNQICCFGSNTKSLKMQIFLLVFIRQDFKVSLHLCCISVFFSVWIIVYMLLKMMMMVMISVAWKCVSSSSVK